MSGFKVADLKLDTLYMSHMVLCMRGGTRARERGGRDGVGGE